MRSVVIAAGLAGCQSATDVCLFDDLGCGMEVGQPGETACNNGPCPEGGEIRHENVRMLGMPVQTWIQVYQYSGPPLSATAPFPAPASGGLGKWGACVDERTNPTWPFAPITGATYLTLPKVQLTGPGILGILDIVETNPPNTTGNLTFRMHDFTYGGGAPGNPPSGFNGTLTDADSMPGGQYTLDIDKIGKKDAFGRLTKMNYDMPEAYTAPLGIGGSATVMIAAGEDLTFRWTQPPNDLGPDPTNHPIHTRRTYVNFTFFVDPTAASPPLFICFPSTDGIQGVQTIPKAVIDALPAGGLIVNADMILYLDAREANPGEMRRFDLVTTYSSISQYSQYSKQ